MTAILLIFFALALLAEGVVTTLPLTLVALIILLLQKRENWIFTLAFVSGVILDLFTLRTVGQTSIFFVVFLFFILLYEKKYEIQTLPFVLLTSFSGSLIYLFYTRAGFILAQALTAAVLAGILFLCYKTYRRRYMVKNHF